jgi:hypothetical protein
MVRTGKSRLLVCWRQYNTGFASLLSFQITFWQLVESQGMADILFMACDWSQLAYWILPDLYSDRYEQALIFLKLLSTELAFFNGRHARIPIDKFAHSLAAFHSRRQAESGRRPVCPMTKLWDRGQTAVPRDRVTSARTHACVDLAARSTAAQWRVITI